MPRRVSLCLAIIATGLALRTFGYQLGLPYVIVKYGGSILWGAMVYVLVALVAGRHSRFIMAAIACVIAITVEVSRLVHTPDLDAFRHTTAGALLLGRIFSLWNLPAYAAGIALAVLADRRRR